MCSFQTSATVIQNIQPIIDVTQYSRIAPDQLKEKLGNPAAEYEENWTVPSSGEKSAMKIYYYDLNGNYTKFLVIDDAVDKMNIFQQTIQTMLSQLKIKKKCLLF